MRAPNGDVSEVLQSFKQMATEAGRDPQSLPVSLFAVPENPDLLQRYRDLGVARAIVYLNSEKADKILPVLDRWAGLIRQAGR